MKFGKRLQQQIEATLPEWRDKFLSYKPLKKLVRLISAAPGGGRAEVEFVRLLVREVDKFNAFFVEQEEDFVILHEAIHERIREVIDTVGPAGSRPSEAEYAAEMGRIRRDIVNLHGKMVLLENYSNVNYTGLAKILKKYDKRTGRALRLLFIEKVLKQPFFTTDQISKLVKELETTVAAVFPASAELDTEPSTAAEPAEQEEDILRNTKAALLTMQELRRGSSTYGHFSLPPLILPDVDPLQDCQLPSAIPTQ